MNKGGLDPFGCIGTIESQVTVFSSIFNKLASPLTVEYSNNEERGKR